MQLPTNTSASDQPARGKNAAASQAALLIPQPDDARGQRHHAIAQQFLQEQRLLGWVHEQNVGKGLAPSAGAVLRQWSAGSSTDARVAMPCSRRSKYRWLRRWMLRWGGRKGVFKVGDRLPLHLVREKVLRGAVLVSRFGFTVAVLVGFQGPSFPSRKWTPFWALWYTCLLKRVPKTEHGMGPSKPTFGHHGNSTVHLCLEALACWNWNNFLEAQNLQGKPVLHINLDESCVRMHSGPCKGIVVAPTGVPLKTFLKQETRASLRLRRSAVTLVAMVCDCAATQRLLPQVIVGNEHVLSKQDMELITSACPPNVFVLRRKSSWLTADLLVHILKLLAACLDRVLPHRHVFLSMDACRIHLTESVATACSKAGIHLMYIPAGMTAWLQPCDTHVFSKFKRFLGQGYEELQLAAPDGDVSVAQMVGLICRGVSEVMDSQCWLRAFQHTGLRDKQAHVSQSLLGRLSYSSPPSVPATLPSLEELQAIYPGRSQVPLDAIFGLFVRSSEAQSTAVCES
jgi:hypothetical protein